RGERFATWQDGTLAHLRKQNLSPQVARQLERRWKRGLGRDRAVEQHQQAIDASKRAALRVRANEQEGLVRMGCHRALGTSEAKWLPVGTGMRCQNDEIDRLATRDLQDLMCRAPIRGLHADRDHRLCHFAWPL